jgi:sorbitol/mannitol transport system substrate-binding protein
MKFTPVIAGAFLVALASTASAETLTIATVNNGDMIRMQKMTDDFTKSNPDIQLQWVTMEENVLRQKVTTDIATKGGQYDIITIGTYEAPIWAKEGWLVPLDQLGADYDVDDLLPAIRGGLSMDGKLYAAPFYGESSMVMYRKDLMDKAGLKMPDAPTWDQIKDAADKMTDRANGIKGRLGREHGVPDGDVELVRRPLVRRKLEAAIRPAGVEGDAAVLCRPDEG